jgi:hypothetical protein
LGIKPTVFYGWQRLLFENAHLAFENGRKPKTVEPCVAAVAVAIDRLGRA